GVGAAAARSRTEFQKPLPCDVGFSDAGAGGGSLGYTAAGSIVGASKELASLPRYESPSVSGLPGPAVAVWISSDCALIWNFTVVPVGTVSVPGRKPKYSTPWAP